MNADTVKVFRKIVREELRKVVKEEIEKYFVTTAVREAIVEAIGLGLLNENAPVSKSTYKEEPKKKQLTSNKSLRESLRDRIFPEGDESEFRSLRRKTSDVQGSSALQQSIAEFAAVNEDPTAYTSQSLPSVLDFAEATDAPELDFLKKDYSAHLNFKRD